MTKYPPFPIHPALIPFLKEHNGSSTDEEACQPANIASFFDAQASLIPVPEVHVEAKQVVAGPHKTKVNLTIIRPIGSENSILPALLYMHGGGWIMGSFITHGSLVRRLAIELPAVIVFVDYSLSPDVKYPVALEECYDALCWTAENAAELRIDPKKIAAGGDSAGGNLTAALALLAKERNNDVLTSQVLYYPALDNRCDTPSFEQFKDDSFLPKKAMEYVWDAYALPEKREQVLVAPGRASIDQLDGLPPALVVTAQTDVLQSEGEDYAKKLAKAGVETLPVRYLGVRHGFLTEPPLKGQAKAAIAQTVYYLRNIWRMDSKM
ncbi:hypothetical protein EC973_000276 [Apophysomyces ossiformis]|uniref:Alpha/beta hydrolase fold-3 domain-containing protein n=1 Tax=Apophysomyces ossiformis TaxID=679940 RepID=A0A8H7EV97_9FUNG|nr:hypothetical protein EC973_000276 [Apophysomyces ossiformis]